MIKLIKKKISKLSFPDLDSGFIYNLILAMAISVSTLWFMRPFTFYIFGQDSFSFIHPMYYSVNPFFSYNNNIENIFSSSLLSLISQIVASPQILERLLAVVGVFISLLGLLDLIKLFKKISGARSASPLLMIAPMVFYVYNPYTLTVTWPHFLFWSASLIVAPFIISFYTYTIFCGFNWKRLALTSLILLLFEGSVAGSMLPFFLIISLLSFLITGFVNIIKKNNVKELLKQEFSIIALVILSTTYTFIPLYFSAIYSISAGYSHGFILQFFSSESATTTLLNVLTFLGFNQVGPGSLSYPWIGLLHQIYVFSLILIIIIFVRIVVKGIEKPFAILGLAAFLSVFFSVGSNVPFGYINEKLVLLGGPFLFLINPYYFTMQYYVLFVSVMLFYVIDDLFKLMMKDSSLYKGQWKSFHFLRNKSVRASLFTFTVIIVAFFVLLTPFARIQVYQTQGNYIDEVNIDNGVIGLDHFFMKSNYKSPEYLSILLPLSSFSGRTNLEYCNSTFADSTGLIKSIDPYPLIWNDNSYLATSIENYFSSGNFNNLGGVMAYLHVKYIIFTYSYSHFQYMEQSPDGNYYNMSEIFSALNRNFGNPLIFGSFYLFVNNNVTPIAGVVNQPYVINTNLSEYLNFLGNINPSSVPTSFISSLQSAILSNISPLKPNAALYYYNNGTERIPYKSGDVMFFSRNGSSMSMNSSYYVSEPGFIIIHPTTLGDLGTLNYTTNMVNSEQIFHNNASFTGFLDLEQKFHELDEFKIVFLPRFTNISQVIYFQLAFGNDTGNFYIMYLKGFVVFGYEFNFPDLGYYAWDSLEMNPYVNNNTMILRIAVQPNELITGNLSIPYFNQSLQLNAYYSPSTYINDPGHQADNFPKNYIIPANFTFSVISSQGVSFALDSLTVYRTPNLGYIFEGNPEVRSTISSNTLTVGTFGNIYLRDVNEKVSNDSYVYFFNPPALSSWEVLIGMNASTMVEPNNFSTVALIPLHSGSRITNIKINFNSYDPVFVMVGIGEFAVIGTILLMYFILYSIKRFKARKE